jgi:tetratricopeptide (TPR) repeat protein
LKDYAAALTDFDRAVAMAPNNGFHCFWRGRTYRDLGDAPNMSADFDQALRLLPHDITGDSRRAWIRLVSGDLTGAQAPLATVEALLAKEGRPAYVIASAYALLGDAGNTLLWLGRAFVRDRTLLDEALSDSDFGALRDQPAFIALVSEFAGDPPDSATGR